MKKRLIVLTLMFSLVILTSTVNTKKIIASTETKPSRPTEMKTKPRCNLPPHPIAD